MAKKLLVLGSDGLLGSRITSGAWLKDWDILTDKRLPKSRVDLSDSDDCLRLLTHAMPDAILNLVALTNVDVCEAQPVRAYSANVKVVENIANWMHGLNKDVHFVHLSTDQVYSGVGPHPESFAAPMNYYGFSKYAGELAAKGVGATILRTNFIGKSATPARQSLTDWLFESLAAGKRTTVFTDLFFTPISLNTLCRYIEIVLTSGKRGTFNVGSRDGMSKAEFAENFARRLGANMHLLVHCESSSTGLLRAPRPSDMRMNVQKFEDLIQMNLPDLSHEIDIVIKEYV